MIGRLIDFLCDRHRRAVLSTRTWPADLNGSTACMSGCRSGGGLLLPHLDSREQLAIHEAGHAVVHLLCGTSIDRAVIAEGDITAMTNPGGVHLNDDSYPAKALMAGAAAVERWATMWAYPLGDADLVDIASGARSDFEIAWGCGLSEADVGFALREADADVVTHWAAVERVGDALLSHGRLSGDQIAALAGVTFPA